ncbi:hypothetical protein GCM10011351_11120 [Paraliobacillus quinghaiensis]|uniref:Uncharacterized protein n=1 Tax=Paraliobacillus quinghaiensis TaxID=470815 RepID=A0A917TLN4_9BACI|nr:hypothetical protein [Paraliobacillus quinghaiensis]GGM27109.1 hypothetical protein GCM10011351_11120 [Paraliobacillus quinghaiensis]
MFINNIKNLSFYSQLSLKHVEDRLLIKADFPKEFLIQNNMTEPFFYVTLYVRGGERIKVIDEGTAKLYSPTRNEFDTDTYKEIIKFAMKNSKQFNHLTIE